MWTGNKAQMSQESAGEEQTPTANIKKKRYNKWEKKLTSLGHIITDKVKCSVEIYRRVETVK